MFVIFYGPEGSGKTTQAKLLGEKLNLPVLVSGDLVRHYAEIDKGIMGEICKEALETGHYVADSEMFVLWKHRLKQPDTDNGFVIDGFPRNLTQAKFLEEKIEKYERKIDFVFYLKVREKMSIERLLKRGRRLGNGKLHDSPELVRERLRRYKAEEEGVLDFYKKKKSLVEINGERTIEEIHQEIMKRVNGRNNA